MKRCEEETGSPWWEPLGYKGASSIKAAAWPSKKKKAKGRNRGKYRDTEADLQEEEYEALDYLDHLYVELQEKDTLKRFIRIEELEIDFLDVSLKNIDKCDQQCSICMEPLHECDLLVRRIEDATDREAALGRKRYTWKDLPPLFELETWTQRQKAEPGQQLYPPSEYKHLDDLVKEDMEDFYYAIASAYYRLVKLADTWADEMPESMCQHPAKLSCGHVFGFDCISDVCISSQKSRLSKARRPKADFGY